MSRNKKGRLYRIVVILIAYLLLGVAVFAPLASTKNHEVLIYILLGVYGVAIVLTILITEIRVSLKEKKAQQADE